MVRKNNKKLVEKEHTSRHNVFLKPHATTYCEVRASQCAVYSVAYKGIVTAYERTLVNFLKCTYHSCHPVDGHQIQPLLGSTDHATDCPALPVA